MMGAEVELLAPRDAARVLAVSARKLWAITFEERPGLPYVRIGRLVRYRPADLRAFLEARVVRSLTDDAGRRGLDLRTGAEVEATGNG